MNALSFPGFDTITSTFIKYVQTSTKQHEQGWENINVLAPPIAVLFRLLKKPIKKATIPRSWKEAKLTPIH